MITNFANLRRVLPAMLLMVSVFLIEVTTGLLAGTVSYILIALFLLWFATSARSIIGLGVLSTIFIIAGFFITSEKMMTTESVALNRMLTLTGVWLAVYFSLRYRKISVQEKKLQTQLTTLFEHCSDGLIFLNESGQILLANTSAAAIFGYQQDELLKSHVGDLIADGGNLFPLKTESGSETESSSRVVTPKGRKKDGRAVPLEVRITTHRISDEPLSILFITDITNKMEEESRVARNLAKIERYNAELEEKVTRRTKELEDALEETGEINQSLLEEIRTRQTVEKELQKLQEVYVQMARNFPEGIIGVLDNDRRFIFVDGEDLDVLGVSEGMCLDALLDASGIEQLKAVFSGQKKIRLDIEINAKAYTIAAVPLDREPDEEPEALVVIRNIVHRKKAEKDLLRNLERERTLNMLKSRFITAASHQFRTPLTTILTSSTLLQKYNQDGPVEKRAVHINRIRNCVNVLNELLTDFLSLSELEEGKIKPVYTSFNIQDLVKRVISEVQVRHKDEHPVVLNCEALCPVVGQDQHILQRIVSDLLSNAIKYSDPSLPIVINITVADGELKVCVSDAGIGISEEDSAHVFDRFFRGKNAIDIEGTGLGLNIVKKFVDLLGGSISFISKENEGTSFSVTLPLQSGVPALQAEPSS